MCWWNNVGWRCKGEWYGGGPGDRRKGQGSLRHRRLFWIERGQINVMQRRWFFRGPLHREVRGYNSVRRLCRDTTCIHCRRKYLSVFAGEKSLFLRRKNSICHKCCCSQIECHLTCTSDFPIYHTRHHVWKNKHETEIHTLSVQLNPLVFFHISHVKYNISQIHLNICSFFAKEKYNIVFNTIEKKVEDTWMQYK